MKLPQLLPHCDHPHFCISCRDLEKGRSFRLGVLKRQGIDCDVDFECPKGKSWNMINLVLDCENAHKSEDLRYAIRSLVAYFPQLGDIWVTGQRPHWYRGKFTTENLPPEYLRWPANQILLMTTIESDLPRTPVLVTKDKHFTQLAIDFENQQLLEIPTMQKGILGFLKKRFPDPSDVEVAEGKRNRPTAKQVITLATALATAKTVSLEVMQERLDTCFECSHVKSDGKTKFCGLCGCSVSSDDNKIVNLAKYEENLPQWGCKHPKRHRGYGWKKI